MSSPKKSSGRFATTTVIHLVLLLTVVLAGTLCQAADNCTTPVCKCGNSESLPPGLGDGTQDVQVTSGTCSVHAGTYGYHNFNIYMGGTLQFVDDGDIDLWAANILVENNGSLLAGTTASPFANKLTIHLWGKDQGAGTGKGDGGAGIRCLSDTKNQCGVDDATWTSNCPNHDCGMTMPMFPPPCNTVELPGHVTDCFYPYMPLEYDDGTSGDPPVVGYFGYKVLAVSYGGTLQLFGKKGADYNTSPPPQPFDSGTSWARLNGSLAVRATTLVLDRAVDWAIGDDIVVTTTDYLPGHSEQLTVQAIPDKKTITFTRNGSVCTSEDNKGVCYPHNGTTFDISTVPGGVGPDQDPNVTCSPGQTRCVETRAAVGLLTRSIKIVSEGDTCCKKNSLPPDSYFGGHTIVRQGFAAFQMQGVEFYQMGQGGRIMHYPVHFHMARHTPQPDGKSFLGTFVTDSSVWDSMTRWYTIHATQGVTLARNVGYLSIGNGYYLEDGSETDNLLYSNLGVFARAAIDNQQNPRKVPGILGFDVYNPTLFWMMNGWNDFEYNMASGAGTCGTCYWFVPANVSGDSQFEYWKSYAGEQQGADNGRAGITPLRKFVGNSCTSAEYSFNTTGAAAPCLGAIEDLKPIPNNLPHDNPRVLEGSSRQATQCPSDSDDDCSKVAPCSYSPDGLTEPNCMITDIDHYTTSFHWAALDIGAIWLRKQWYLFTNSAVTDVQQGGLTFVSGGGYTGADEVPGYWALAHKDVFIGNTQAGNPFASNAGPFNPKGLTCDPPIHHGYCANLNEGISIPLNNFGAGQRLFSIYDGPAYEEGNAYLDITKTNLTGCKQDLSGDECKLWAAAGQVQAGVLWDPKSQQCYLPNAAIAWKQPNGFYYPPAFHSSGLYFNHVEIRHFVIDPLFLPVGDDGLKTDVLRAKARYCGDVGDEDHGIFQNFTDIDRQTELSDDDGSLTGLRGPVVPQDPPESSPSYFPSISVNKDAFFGVPLETAECASDIPELMPQGKDCPYGQFPDLCATANTSPYDYVTTVVFPDPKDPGWWIPKCETPDCYGVPLYREDENYLKEGATQIRMMGQETSQRSNLTVNHGRYYIDTTVSKARQYLWAGLSTGYNVFMAGKTYHVFLLFAKPSTSQTYDLFVGKSFDPKTMLRKIRVDQEPNRPAFTDVGGYDCDANPTECSFDPKGYLTVTLDLSGSKDEYDAARKYACRPETFCSWDATKNPSCFCNPAQQGASKAECDNACNNWATKDIRCPKNAQGVSECYGFAFTLPSDFPEDDQVVSMPPPYVQCFNKELNWEKNWNVSFEKPATQDNGTVSCDYGDKLPRAQFCPANPGNKVLGTGVGSTGSRNQP